MNHLILTSLQLNLLNLFSNKQQHNLTSLSTNHVTYIRAAPNLILLDLTIRPNTKYLPQYSARAKAVGE